MTEHRSFFKQPKAEKAPRAWNSTLPRSKKRMKSRTRKAAADDQTFKQGPRQAVCQRCTRRPACDASHRAPRSQRPDLRGNAANRDDLCRECHEWVEANPEAAKEEGWRDSETFEKANPYPWSKLERQANR